MSSNLRKSSLASITGIAPVSQDAPEGLPDRPLDAAQASGGLPPLSPASGSSLSLSDVAAGIRPTEAQIRVKSRFWAEMAKNPLIQPQGVTLALAQQLTQSAALADWWKKPGFREWFLATSVTEERLDYLFHLALQTAEDVLLNTDPKAQSARVSMVKIVAEMVGKGKSAVAAGKEGGKTSAKQDAINGMSREELTTFLQDNGIKVEQVVSLNPTDKK